MPQLGPADPGKREQLDTVKHELYGFIQELWTAVSPATIADKLGEEPFGLFSGDQLADPLRHEVSPQAFAQEHRPQLDALLDSLISNIEVVRISPLDGDPKRLPPKQLMGVGVHHFAAFFARKAREHDFLWGRLDGAEQLLSIVAPDIDPGWYRRAFQAVLDEEQQSLTTIGSTIQDVRDRISTLGTGTEPALDTPPPQG